jgi:hypothetical protein
MMKAPVLFVALVFGWLAAYSVQVADALQVNIFDLDEGPPVIVTDLRDQTIFVTPESATISGFLVITPPNANIFPFEFIPVGQSAVFLTEPGAPTVISDVVLLTVSPGEVVDGVGQQFLTVNFQSDPVDLTQFPALPVPFANVRRVVEDGTLQNLIGAPGFAVRVQSDIDSVPEPGSLILLGSGFVGLAGATWRRRCPTGFSKVTTNTRSLATVAAMLLAATLWSTSAQATLIGDTITAIGVGTLTPTTATIGAGIEFTGVTGFLNFDFGASRHSV